MQRIWMNFMGSYSKNIENVWPISLWQALKLFTKKKIHFRHGTEGLMLCLWNRSKAILFGELSGPSLWNIIESHHVLDIEEFCIMAGKLFSKKASLPVDSAEAIQRLLSILLFYFES